MPFGSSHCVFGSTKSKSVRGMLCEYMGQKRRKCPKKRVSSLWQLRSQRGLPGRTARAFCALSGTQGVHRSNRSE